MSLLERTPSLAQVRDNNGDPLAFYLYPDIDRLDEMIALLNEYGVDLMRRVAAGPGCSIMGSNGTVEIGGPEPFYLDGLIQRVLGARNDPRDVILDPHARLIHQPSCSIRIQATDPDSSPPKLQLGINPRPKSFVPAGLPLFPEMWQLATT
jgi:hypothetical protein